MRAKESGQPYDEQELATQVKTSVAEVVRQQVEAGIDVISDGEYGKPSFSAYANDRLTGFERRPRNPDESPILNWGRDRKAFLDFYEGYEQASRTSQSAPPSSAPDPSPPWARTQVAPTPAPSGRR